MQDPDQKCRHFGISWHFIAFLPKSLKRNQIRFFRFFPIFRLFPTFRLSDSTALFLIQIHLLCDFNLILSTSSIISVEEAYSLFCLLKVHVYRQRCLQKGYNFNKDVKVHLMGSAVEDRLACFIM